MFGGRDITLLLHLMIKYITFVQKNPMFKNISVFFMKLFQVVNLLCVICAYPMRLRRHACYVRARAERVRRIRNNKVCLELS